MTRSRAVGHRGLVPLQDVARPVRVLVLARFVNRLGAFSMPFLAVLLVQEHGSSPGVAGLVVASFGVATIPSRLLGGRLVGGVGAKRTVVAGLVGTAGSQLVLALAPNLGVALGGALCLGLSFEVYEPASQGLVADVTPDEHLPLAYGLLGTALALAGVVAGLLAAVVGRVGLRWLFVVDAGTAVACALLVALALHARHTAPDPVERSSGPTPWRDRRLLVLMATGTAFATVYVSIPMAMPLSLVAAGRPASDAGLLEALGAVVVVAAQPLLARTGPTGPRLVTGYALIAGGTAVAAALPTMAGYAVAILAVSAGDVLLLGSAYTLVARIAPAGAKARYFAVYGVTWGVALTLGPTLMGVLLAHGTATFWAAASVAMLLTGVAQARLGRHLAG